MELPELLHKIDELQASITAHGPLSVEAKRKLDYKLRLEWNYHSNAMEGGTLTKAATREVMMGGVTVGNHPIKDWFEMTGHNEVLTKLMAMAKGELRLSESRIRDTHKGILQEQDEVREAMIGNWKSEPNEIINYKGEKYEFLAPALVAEAMHALINRTNAEVDRIVTGKADAMHPALLAFRFHLDYITIHPFHDGNGRTARIFSNLLLMRFGYPPVIITLQEKDAYNRYLAEVQAYGANPDLFFAFMAERLIRSQELVLDAIAGKSLDEPDDLEKRLRLIDTKLAGFEGQEEITRVRSTEAIKALMVEWGYLLVNESALLAHRFEHYFLSSQHHASAFSSKIDQMFKDIAPEEVAAHLRSKFEVEGDLNGVGEIRIALNYGSFKKATRKPFGCNYGVSIKLDDFHHYSVLVDVFHTNGARQQETLYKRLLHQPLTAAEVKAVVQRMGKEIADHIDYHMDQDMKAADLAPDQAPPQP